MNRFLKYVLLFSCIITVCLAAGEFVCRRLPTSYSYKADWMRRNADKINTLVLGSSHTYYGIQPSILGDSVFNLANISQTPEYDLALLEEYLPDMHSLRKVIIPISYFTFRDPSLEEMSPGLCVNYKVGMRLPVHSDFSRYNFTITDFKVYAGRLRGLVQTQEQNKCDSLGFGLGFDLAHRDRQWEVGGKQRARDLTQDSPGRANRVYSVLEKLIRLCGSHDLECVFITTPVWKTFRANTDPAQLKEMRYLTSELIGEYGLRYFDYYADDRFAEKDFHDSDHLSDIGARKLSELLRFDLRHSDCPGDSSEMQ